MAKKYTYEVTIQAGSGTKTFTYDDYDSVQNLIGYMVEGNDFTQFEIQRYDAGGTK